MSAMGRALIEIFDDEDLTLLREILGVHQHSAAESVRATEGERWLDSRGAAEFLGLGKDALNKLCAARAIPFEQEAPGCKRWFKSSELDAWRRAGGRSAYLHRKF